MTDGIADKSIGKKTQLESIADCIRSKYEDINNGGDEADKVLAAGKTSKARKEEELVTKKEKKSSSNLVLFLSLSPSPEARAGLLPSIITLNDYGITRLGSIADLHVGHIREVDLTGNLISSWQEVLAILKAFPSITFLNLAYNQLEARMETPEGSTSAASYSLTRLVLNGNPVNWSSITCLLHLLPNLNELRASNCNLADPVLDKEKVEHANLTHLYLSRNRLSCFSTLASQVLARLPALTCLSVADCPQINKLPDLEAIKLVPGTLHTLNISSTGIDTLEELERVAEVSYQLLDDKKVNLVVAVARCAPSPPARLSSAPQPRGEQSRGDSLDEPQLGHKTSGDTNSNKSTKYGRKLM